MNISVNNLTRYSDNELHAVLTVSKVPNVIATFATMSAPFEKLTIS